MNIVIDNQVEVVCTTPTRKLDGTESIEELRQLKAEWLSAAKANGDIENCVLVVKTLGSPFGVPRRETSLHLRWTAGNVTLEYHEIPTGYNPATRKYGLSRTLNVFVNDRQTVFYRESDTPTQERDDVYFVPGRWLSTIYAHFAEASQVHADRSGSLVDQHRRGLLKQLCFGADI